MKGIVLNNCDGFAWDKGNINKNLDKHGVSKNECEELFFNQPLFVACDEKHSITEMRCYALGKTDKSRLLFIVFTIRNNKIRVISARDMTAKNGGFTMKKQNKIPAFKNEDEEREFWSKHDSTEYINWNQSNVAISPKLKPSTKTISLRLPDYMLAELRTIANKRDVPYQSLIKIFLKEQIDKELQIVN